MQILAIETYPAKPHLETAAEVLLDRVGRESAAFAYAGNGLPWQEYPQTLLGAGALLDMPSRVKALQSMLAQRGITIAEDPSVEPAMIREIEQWSAAFNDDLAILKRYAWKGHTLGLGVASSLISKYRNPALCTHENLAQIRAALRAAALVFERSRALIERHRPEAVLTFNGRFALCYPVVKAAQAAGCRVLLHERGCDYRKYEVFDTSVHSIEKLRDRIQRHWDARSDDTAARRTGEEFFQRRRCGDGIGWKSFIDGQTRGLTLPSDGRKRVVYFSSSEDELAAVEDGAVQKFAPEGQKSAVLKLVSACRKVADVELIVRVHPNAADCHLSELTWWSALAAQGVKVIEPKAKVDSYALLESANLVCSYGSTIGVEAAYWGRASALLGDAGYFGFGCCAEPIDEEELAGLIRNVPREWSREACLRYGYYIATFGREYHHYEPTSLFDGELLGHALSHRSALGAMIACLRRTYRKFSR